MNTLQEASNLVASQLRAIAEHEHCAPVIVGVHSIASVGNGVVSVYLDLHPPQCNGGLGCMALVNEDEIRDLDHTALLAALAGQ
jgi:hypothetical protein